MMESGFAFVDGIKVHYLSSGKPGKDILLIHGWKGSAKVWAPVLESGLAKGFRLVAPSLPGFGESDKPMDFDYSIAGLANFLAGFVSAFRLKPFAIVGHSLGGLVVLKYAAQHKIPKLVLAATPLSARVASILKAYASCKPFALLLDISLKIPGIEYLEFMFHHIVYRLTRKLLAEYAPEIKKASPIASQESSRDALRLLRTRSLLELADNSNVLYVRGEKDNFVPDFPALKKAKVVEFKGVGHCPMLEDEKRFVEEVEKFLQTE